MAEAWPGLEVGGWFRTYRPEARFMVDDADGDQWITVTTTRVPCMEVDAVLARLQDPNQGEPDRCARWVRAAEHTMQKHGITGRTTDEFLEQIGANRSIRVMAIYAGWVRNSETDGRIRLVDARAARLYPPAPFKQQNNEAQNEIFRLMKLGPYADIS